MAMGPNGAVIRHVNRLFESGTVAGLSEPELLNRFVNRRDESAFEALVARHGPMVLGVCRRVLADSNDVDDAFQATFLVLVKKAETLHDRTLLANWLYGVARHVSLKARAKASRRRAIEGAGIDQAGRIPARESVEHPLKPILDEELARLPERDRAAIVLCDLEGFTGEEAASALGLRAVTLRSRLHRARIKLKGRLARRGLVAGAVLKTAMLAASPPQALADSTVKAAIAFAANPAALGAISASVFALTREVLTSMMLTKMKSAAMVVVALGLVGTTAGVVAQDPTPTRSAKDDDRLREVEQKLDRVLQALEGRKSPTPAASAPLPHSSSVGPDVEPLVRPANRSPFQVDPIATDSPPKVEYHTFTTTDVVRPGAAPFASGSDQPRSADARPASPPTATPSYPPAPVYLPAGERLNQVERRLDDIEKRLMRLEQKVGIMSGDIRPTTVAPPPVYAPRAGDPGATVVPR